MSAGRSAAPAVMKVGNRVPVVTRSTIPPSWSTPMVTGKRRPASAAARCRARLLRRTWSVPATFSLNRTTPPRCSRFTRRVGAAVPSYDATITCPARSAQRQLRRPAGGRGRSRPRWGPSRCRSAAAPCSALSPAGAATPQARGSDSSRSTSAAISVAPDASGSPAGLQADSSGRATAAATSTRPVPCTRTTFPVCDGPRQIGRPWTSSHPRRGRHDDGGAGRYDDPAVARLHTGSQLSSTAPDVSTCHGSSPRFTSTRWSPRRTASLRAAWSQSAATRVRSPLPRSGCGAGPRSGRGTTAAAARARPARARTSPASTGPPSPGPAGRAPPPRPSRARRTRCAGPAGPPRRGRGPGGR